MFAVIKTGGKQYRVSEGDCISVERLAAAPGELVEFDQVLLVEKDDKLVTQDSLLNKAKVVGRVVEQNRAGKIIGFKSKRRKGYRRKWGHRQYFTGVAIQEIKV